ncbi:MAG TPA: nucleotide sugar dehydrogenase, partial [Phycisphaerales bacterium]|nr:nucleotide sugar dehydrogenase [Phycisphaerales bacterium]
MNDARDHLEALIASREVRIAVIGLGYVGLPLAHALYAGGARVLGVDNDPAKIESLNAGRNYLKHLGDAMAAELAASDRFDVTTDFERLAEVDVVLVCVPTPLRAGRVPDLSYVERTGVEIGRRLHAGQLVVLESTTYPGTTRREFAGAIEAGASDRRISLRLGQEYWIAFSPEREDPGRKSHTTASIPKLVGGLDTEATRLAAGVYRLGIKEVIEVESAEVAEAAKILENVYRAVNIAMVNEMKTILTDMGINIFDVIRAAATKPFGFEAFWPGPGLGGHCIPIDPYYLSWRAKQIGHEARFIELAGEINHAMPGYVVERTIAALSKRGRL